MKMVQSCHPRDRKHGSEVSNRMFSTTRGHGTRPGPSDAEVKQGIHWYLYHETETHRAYKSQANIHHSKQHTTSQASAPLNPAPLTTLKFFFKQCQPSPSSSPSAASSSPKSTTNSLRARVPNLPVLSVYSSTISPTKLSTSRVRVCTMAFGPRADLCLRALVRTKLRLGCASPTGQVSVFFCLPARGFCG